MFEPLDIRTTLQVGAMTCLVLAVVMVYYSVARKTYPGFHSWTLGIVSASIGAVLVSMRGFIPTFLTIIIGNFLIVLMPFMLAYGFSTFFGVRWRLMPFYSFVLCAFLLFYVWWTFGSPSLYYRVICLCVVLIILFGESLRIVMSYSKSILKEYDLILVVFLVFTMSSSFLRLVVTMKHKPPVSFLNNVEVWSSVAILMTIIGIVGIISSLIIINSHRIELDLLKVGRKIERLARLDGLTNLFNRRCFDEKLTEEFRRAQRASRPISLIMADIDFFKLYNDTYGHQSGDDCLKEIASIFQKCSRRASDIAARYGGEEFVLLLPDTDSAGARNVANEIQNSIQAKAIAHKASCVANVVTISIGVSTIRPDSMMQPDDLVKYADQALYASKKKGKNQIQQYEV